MYASNALVHWVSRDITWRSALRALRERPIAVAGRGGAYVVDPDFEWTQSLRPVFARELVSTAFDVLTASH
jgi:hypothetical protein